MPIDSTTPVLHANRQGANRQSADTGQGANRPEWRGPARGSNGSASGSTGTSRHAGAPGPTVQASRSSDRLAAPPTWAAAASSDVGTTTRRASASRVYTLLSTMLAATHQAAEEVVQASPGPARAEAGLATVRALAAEFHDAGQLEVAQRNTEQQAQRRTQALIASIQF